MLGLAACKQTDESVDNLLLTIDAVVVALRPGKCLVVRNGSSMSRHHFAYSRRWHSSAELPLAVEKYWLRSKQMRNVCREDAWRGGCTAHIERICVVCCPRIEGSDFTTTANRPATPTDDTANTDKVRFLNRQIRTLEQNTVPRFPTREFHSTAGSHTPPGASNH